MNHQALGVACPAEGLSTPANLGGHQHHEMSQQRPKLSAVLPESAAFYLLASTAFQLQLMSHLYTVCEWVQKVACKSALGSCLHMVTCVQNSNSSAVSDHRAVQVSWGSCTETPRVG